MRRKGRALDILLVEDNPDDIALAGRLADRSELPVRLNTVNDGRAALQYLQHRRPQAATPALILLDIHLPGMDGIELLRRLKEDAELQSIPVILLTGSEEERHVRLGQELGAHSHILKPMSAQSFRWIATSVRNYLERIATLSSGTA